MISQVVLLICILFKSSRYAFSRTLKARQRSWIHYFVFCWVFTRQRCFTYLIERLTYLLWRTIINFVCTLVHIDILILISAINRWNSNNNNTLYSLHTIPIIFIVYHYGCYTVIIFKNVCVYGICLHDNQANASDNIIYNITHIWTHYNCIRLYFHRTNTRFDHLNI